MTLVIITTVTILTESAMFIRWYNMLYFLYVYKLGLVLPTIFMTHVVYCAVKCRSAKQELYSYIFLLIISYNSDYCRYNVASFTVATGRSFAGKVSDSSVKLKHD